RLDVRLTWMHQALLRRHDVVHGNAQMICSVDASWRFQHCVLVDERNQMACARFGDDIRHETERANMQPDRTRTGRNFLSSHLLKLNRTEMRRNALRRTDAFLMSHTTDASH